MTLREEAEKFTKEKEREEACKLVQEYIKKIKYYKQLVFDLESEITKLENNYHKEI